ncbi:MAG: HAMP domain-containing histidine kinase [Chloroflexi bacterium]|nr:HAMP domain-containing histidine kinase [Chloroflexota bacterium]
MSYVDRLASRFGGLHWRLTIFYTLVLVGLVGALGWFLDRQLWSLATVQVEQRVAARSTALLGDATPRTQSAAPAKLPIPQVASAQPAPPKAPVVPQRATRLSSSVVALANEAAASEPAGVQTSVLSPSGSVIPPDAVPPGWKPRPAVEPKMAAAALRDGNVIGPTLVETDAGRYVVMYQPVTDQAGMAVVQFASRFDEQVQNLLLSFRLAFGAGLLILVGITLTLGRPLASLALRPLRRLTDIVSHISPDHLNARVPVPRGNDDLHELALAFNSTLERIDRSVQAERRGQDQLRQFLGDASHELRSPLTALIGYNDLLLEQNHSADTPYIARRMRRELERMNGLVGDLLTLTRLDSVTDETYVPAEAVDLVEVAEEVAESFSSAAASRDIAVHRMAAEVWVSGDRDALERVVQNLVANAVQHTADDGLIAVEVESRGSCAHLRVVDDGEGIPVRHQSRVFDRFYRVDPARARDKGNAGLGLAIVRSIVGRHHGQVWVTSTEGLGSTFTVELPLAPPAVRCEAKLLTVA